MSLDAPVSVTKQNLHPLLSTQILFIGFLDALLAYIVSANIDVYKRQEEAPNMDTDIYWLKKKMEMGAEYAVTQLFYDNRKYFDFVERARQAGVTIPIIPGIKPFKKLSQLSMIPKTFKVDLPEELTQEVLKCNTDAEAQQVGIEWCVQQCKELIAHGVPSLHFYSVGATDSIREVAKQIY